MSHADHAALGLDYWDCTLRDVKTAFKRLALRHHPDKNGGHAERFKTIHAAYERLMKHYSPRPDAGAYATGPCEHGDDSGDDPADDYANANGYGDDYADADAYGADYADDYADTEDARREAEEREAAAREVARLQRIAAYRATIGRLVAADWQEPTADESAAVNAVEQRDAAREVKKRLSPDAADIEASIQRGDEHILESEIEKLVAFKVACLKDDFYNKIVQAEEAAYYDKYRRYAAAHMYPRHQQLWAAWVAYIELKKEVEEVSDFTTTTGTVWSGRGVRLTKQDADDFVRVIVDWQRWDKGKRSQAQQCRDAGWIVLSGRGHWVLTESGIKEAENLFA